MPRNEADIARILKTHAWFFRLLDDVVSRFLIKACETSQVLIVTNAHSTWVNFSASVFMKKTYKLFAIDKIVKLISAREQF